MLGGDSSTWAPEPEAELEVYEPEELEVAPVD